MTTKHNKNISTKLLRTAEVEGEPEIDVSHLGPPIKAAFWLRKYGHVRTSDFRT